MTPRGSLALSTVLAGLIAFAAPAQADNIVTNGGFETESFAGWSETGDTMFNGVQCSAPDPSVFEGNCSAYFGGMSVGGIEQILDVGSTGQMWNLSFAFQPDGGNPTSLSVLFGGETLLSLNNPPAGDYAVYSFSGLTTAANMTLAFHFLDPVGFLFLDDVSVSVVPEPATTAMLGAGLLGLLLAARRRKSA